MRPDEIPYLGQTVTVRIVGTYDDAGLIVLQMNHLLTQWVRAVHATLLAGEIPGTLRIGIAGDEGVEVAYVSTD